MNWPFFLLLSAADMASLYAIKLNQVYRSSYWYGELPRVACGPKASLIITLINVPVYWSNVAIFIYGFFILPWQVVLTYEAVGFITVPFCHVALKLLLREFFNAFTAMMLSWAVLFSVTA